jgi:hypothetical protein
MRLWLDDERDPKDPYIQSHFGASGDEVWAKDPHTAIQYLKQGNVTEVSLDHDLGSGVGTGMDVALWIEEQAFLGNLPRLIWSVHSMNPVGRKNMSLALYNANKHWDKHDPQE